MIPDALVTPVMVAFCVVAAAPFAMIFGWMLAGRPARPLWPPEARGFEPIVGGRVPPEGAPPCPSTSQRSAAGERPPG
jgi:hypothetical protein